MADEITYPLILNNSNVVDDAYGNRFRYQFPVGSVSFGKDARVALGSLSIYYSWFNITADLGNNEFSFNWTDGSGTTQYDITVPDGFYSIEDLNSYIQYFCVQNGLYLVDAGGEYIYYIEMLTNATSYAIQVNTYAFPDALPPGYSNPNLLTFPATPQTTQLIVPDTNFKNIIGFANGVYPNAIQTSTQSFLSTFTPQVSPTQSVIVSCSLAQNSYSNPNTIIYNFAPDGTPFGSAITVNPNEYIFCGIAPGAHNDITVEFLDQNYNKIKIIDSNATIKLLIKEKAK
jgi:hypothetical protein